MYCTLAEGLSTTVTTLETSGHRRLRTECMNVCALGALGVQSATSHPGPGS